MTLLMALAGGGAAWLWQRAEAARVRAEAAEEKAAKALDALELAHREVGRVLYAERIRMAQRQWDEGQVEEARRLHAECDPVYRGWEWGHFKRAFHSEAAVLSGHTNRVVEAHFSPDGTVLASAGWDATVRLWDSIGKEVVVLNGHTGRTQSVAFSPDGKRLASAGGDGRVRLWDGIGNEVSALRGDAEAVAVRYVTFSLRGRELAFADDAGAVWLSDGDFTHASHTQVWHRGNNHEGAVLSVSFSPDGTRLASAGKDGTVRLWDEAGREVAEERRQRSDRPVAQMEPDWMVPGKEVAVLRGHTGPVNHIAFSPDGTLLASASDDGTVRLWDEAGEKVAVLRGHADRVLQVAFSPDGTRLASVGWNGRGRLWTVAGEEVAVLRGHTAEVEHVAFSPDGARLATPGGTGRCACGTGPAGNSPSSEDTTAR